MQNICMTLPSTLKQYQGLLLSADNQRPVFCYLLWTGCGYVAAGDSATSALRANVDAFWTFGFGTTTDTMSISFK